VKQALVGERWFYGRSGGLVCHKPWLSDGGSNGDYLLQFTAAFTANGEVNTLALTAKPAFYDCSRLAADAGDRLLCRDLCRFH